MGKVDCQPVPFLERHAFTKFQLILSYIYLFVSKLSAIQASTQFFIRFNTFAALETSCFT